MLLDQQTLTSYTNNTKGDSMFDEIDEETDSDLSSKSEKLIEYIRTLKAIEDAMEPYKESKRELRSDFVKNGFLSKDDISTITRAYRMLKKNESLDALAEAYQTLRGAK
jgi:hypothetical protein